MTTKTINPSDLDLYNRIIFYVNKELAKQNPNKLIKVLFGWV